MAWISLVAVAGVFALSGLWKIKEPLRAGLAVERFTGVELPGSHMKKLAARSVGVLELLVSMLLIAPSTRTIGALLTGALLLAYSALIATSRHLIKECGCWRASTVETPRNALLARNVIVSGLLVAGMAIELPTPSLGLICVGSAVGLALSGVLLELPNVLAIDHFRRSHPSTST